MKQKKFNAKNQIRFTIIAILSVLFVSVFSYEVDAYTIENRSVYYNTPRTVNNIVVAHETANNNSTVDNEVNYMKNNWQNAFVTHFVGGGGRVIQVAPTSYVSWGAGGQANWQSYAQVELARDRSDKEMFRKNYPAYVNLLRDLAKSANIPVTLDSSSTKGIKTHEWISYNLGGSDHTDPYSFLASMGISRGQFQRDIATGLPEDGSYRIGQNGGTQNGSVAVKPKPVTPKPSTPVTGNSGTYTFQYATNVRTAASTSAQIVAQYQPGQSVSYYDTVQANGYTWMKYTAVSGLTRYVAMTNSNSAKPVATTVNKDGTYTFNYATNVRTAPSLSGSIVAQYQPDQTVYYNRIIQAEGFKWMEYRGASGYLRYVAQTN